MDLTKDIALNVNGRYIDTLTINDGPTAATGVPAQALGRWAAKGEMGEGGRGQSPGRPPGHSHH